MPFGPTGLAYRSVPGVILLGGHRGWVALVEAGDPLRRLGVALRVLRTDTAEPLGYAWKMSDKETGAPVDISVITRRQASSGNVSYGDSVLLHDSTVMKIVMVPFFIARTEGTELSVKLITYRKSKLHWFEIEGNAVTLKEPAARSLLKALNAHLAVADHEGDGGYIAIKMVDGVADVGHADPELVAKAVISVLEKQDIAKHLVGAELSSALLQAFRGAIRLKEMATAIEALRNHLHQGEYLEAVYQEWCSKHSWAFGNAYVLTDEVREISPGDNLDLLLPSVLTGFRDIVELKRPDMDVLLRDKGHKNYYFSSDVSKAFGQVHRYLDVLADVAANGLLDHPEIVAYKPRAVIVIGRSDNWGEGKLRALHGLNSRHHGITIMTYDQLLAQGERLIELLTAEIAADAGDDEGSFEEEDFGF